MAQGGVKSVDVSIQKVHIDKKQLEEYKKDPAFNYKQVPVKPNWIERAYLWVKKVLYKILYKLLNVILGAKKAHYVIAKIIKALPYLFIIGFLYFLFRYLLGVNLLNWRTKKQYNQPKIYLNEEERILQEENIEDLMNQAIRDNDYRLAVRYLYLNALKKLSDKKLIDWKPDKTNRQFVKELANHPLSDLFSKLSLIYEYVWYGKNFPKASDFDQLRNEYSNFIKQIK